MHGIDHQPFDYRSPRWAAVDEGKWTARRGFSIHVADHVGKLVGLVPQGHCPALPKNTAETEFGLLSLG